MYILYLYTPTKNLQNKNGLLFLLFEIILAFYRYNFLGLSKNIEFVFFKGGLGTPLFDLAKILELRMLQYRFASWY